MRQRVQIVVIQINELFWLGEWRPRRLESGGIEFVDRRS